MKKQFELLRITRNNVLSAIEGLDNEQLNHIPIGFNNNIIWNVAHLLVTQQLLCYKLAGEKTYIADDWVDQFKKGTSPKAPVNQEFSAQLIDSFKTLPNILEADYTKQQFSKPFSAYKTSYNVELRSIEDAILFNNIHEGLHLGYVMALKKAIKQHQISNI